MTKHHILYPLLIIGLLACGVWIAKQEIANARAEERDKAHQETIQQIKQARDDFDAQLQAVKNKPATVETVTKYLPLPLPPKSEIKVETLPDAPLPQLVLTGDAQENLNAIRDMEVAHLKCDNDLTACGKERDQWKLNSQNWESAAKGGSKMHRFLKVLKVTGCAAGGAALGSLAGHKGAAIGSGAGVVTCSIF